MKSVTSKAGASILVVLLTTWLVLVLVFSPIETPWNSSFNSRLRLQLLCIGHALQNEGSLCLDDELSPANIKSVSATLFDEELRGIVRLVSNCGDIGTLHLGEVELRELSARLRIPSVDVERVSICGNYRVQGRFQRYVFVPVWLQSEESVGIYGVPIAAMIPVLAGNERWCPVLSDIASGRVTMRWLREICDWANLPRVSVLNSEGEFESMLVNDIK